MKNIFEKLTNKVLPFVLCIGIVSGAAAPAYADNSTAAYQYYRAGSTLNPYNQQAGLNSADMIGRLLDVSSYNQSMIYSRLLQMSSSGSDLTTVNSYITSIDTKLGVIRDSLGIGSSLDNVLQNQTSNLQHLNTIISKLSYWDNAHARSYDLSEMIFNSMNYNNQLVENTTSIPAIKNDTSNLITINNNIQSIKDRFLTDSLTQYYNRFYRSDYNGPVYFTSGYGLLSLRANQSGYYVGYNTTENFTGVITNMNNSLVQIGSEIFTPLTVYKSKEYDVNTNSIVENNHVNLSIMDMLYEINNNVLGNLSKLAFVLADDNTIAAKKANQAQEQSVLTNFTGSGAASASVSDFGAVKDSMVDLKAGFTGGASSSDTFSFLSGDSNAWDWFTQDTANDVDRTQRSNTRLLRSSPDVASDTPLLDSYYISIMSILGGDE